METVGVSSRGIIRLLAAFVLSLSLLMGSGAVASTPPPTPQQAIEALAPGQHVVLDNVVVARTVQGLVIELVDHGPNIQLASTFCGAALASAIFGIGAGILGVIAASTGGTGTVMIAGYFLTGAQVGVLAGISGSYAALLAWISRFVC
jgi:uncharacterized membrane-anchored protein YitT (DUF2179 family)